MELIDRTPADTPLRRVAFGGKLLFVTAIGVALTVWRDLPVLGVVAAMTVVLYGVARVPPSAWWRTMRGILFFLLLLIALQWWNGELQRGLIAAARMGTMVSLAALITATTPFEEIITSVQRWVRPLRRFGADPELIALTVGMAVRFIPLMGDAAAETADSLRARGVRPWPWRLMFPLIRRTLLLAEDVGSALAAREPVAEPAA